MYLCRCRYWIAVRWYLLWPPSFIFVTGCIGVGDIVFLTYLLNPFTIAVCVGGSTSSIENLLAILGLYGAMTGLILISRTWVLLLIFLDNMMCFPSTCLISVDQSIILHFKSSIYLPDWVIGKVPLAAFGWAMATHMSMYPVFLFIPVRTDFSTYVYFLIWYLYWLLNV